MPIFPDLPFFGLIMSVFSLSIIAHSKVIRGVHINSANYVVISTSADKTIKVFIISIFWMFILNNYAQL